MKAIAALLLAALLLGGCASADVHFRNPYPEEHLVVPGFLYRPEGTGPFPAVVLLHGCHGLLPTTHEWARWLRDRGYVALAVDSWAPRNLPSGLRKGCRADEPDLPPAERFLDALGALRFLQARPDVVPERIGVMGWSNGGAFAIGVVSATRLERARSKGVDVREPGFRASVAFYPGGCRALPKDTLAKPLLVLIGDADDWTVPGPCVDMVSAMRQRGGPASIVTYPGAYHYFDVAGQAKTRLPDVGNDNAPGGAGATVAYDAPADADARRRVEAFLAERLGAR